MASGRAEPREFPVTSWSLVARAGRRNDEGGREALGRLLADYLPALQAHLMFSKRLQSHEADDVLQDFVAGKILERDLVAQADRNLGKFRTFLLTSLDRYLLNRIRNAGAKKRAAGEAAELLGDQAAELHSANSTHACDIAWARRVLEESLRRMQAECEASGRADLWGVFEARVLLPIRDGAEPTDYRGLIARFGFQSPSQATNALATAKRMYARMLRGVIGEYAQEAEEIDEELNDLHRILAASGRREINV